MTEITQDDIETLKYHLKTVSNNEYQYTKEDCLQAIQYVNTQVPNMTKKEYNATRRPQDPSSDTIMRLWDSWSHAKEVALNE
jgi:hypothetical protein